MENLEKIKQSLKTCGFKETEQNIFVYEQNSYNTMSINGKTYKKKVSNTLCLKYVGVGGIVDENEVCKNDMFFFDIYENDNFKFTLGAYSFKEIEECLK